MSHCQYCLRDEVFQELIESATTILFTVFTYWNTRVLSTIILHDYEQDCYTFKIYSLLEPLFVNSPTPFDFDLNNADDNTQLADLLSILIVYSFI